LIEQGLTSPPTQYRLYGRWFFTGFLQEFNNSLVQTSVNICQPKIISINRHWHLCTQTESSIGCYL